ncbi:MAG: HEAT repeat domain-containing protein [Gemmataceae bacterium]
MKQFDQYLAEISDGDRNDRGNGIGGLAKYSESEWDGALEAVDAAVTVLSKALRRRGTEAADATMRTQAVRVLGNIGIRSTAVVPELLRLIREDPDTGVRTEVARALGRIGVGAKAASDALAAVLSDQDGEDALRCEAARSLGRVDPLGQGTDVALQKAANDRSGLVGVSAAEALWRATGKADLAARALETRLNDLRVRSAAVQVLYRMGTQGKAAVSALLAVAKDKDRLFHESVMMALQNIDPSAVHPTP